MRTAATEPVPGEEDTMDAVVAAGARSGAVRAHLDGHPLCSCGQELDMCHRSHCPRCGHRLAGRAWSRAGSGLA